MQESAALSSQLLSRSESISQVQVRPFPKAQPCNNNKEKGRENQSQKS